MWVLLWGALALADTGDTGSTTDTSTETDTGTPDTDPPPTDTGETDTGEPDTDTGTDPDFAAPSASELSGEVGGFRCATGVTPGLFGLLVGFVLLWRRR